MREKEVCFIFHQVFHWNLFHTKYDICLRNIFLNYSSNILKFIFSKASSSWWLNQNSNALLYELFNFDWCKRAPSFPFVFTFSQNCNSCLFVIHRDIVCFFYLIYNSRIKSVFKWRDIMMITQIFFDPWILR